MRLRVSRARLRFVAGRQQCDQRCRRHASAFTVSVEASEWDSGTSTPPVLIVQQVDTRRFECLCGLEFESEEALRAHAGEGGEAIDGTFGKLMGDPRYAVVGFDGETEVKVDEGAYSISVIPPINADGSTYDVPAAILVGEEEQPGGEALSLSLRHIEAADASSERLSQTIEALAMVNAADRGALSNEMLHRARANAAVSPGMSEEQIAALEAGRTPIVPRGSAAVDSAGTPSRYREPATAVPDDSGIDAPMDGGEAVQPGPSAHSHDFSIPITEQVWIDEGSYFMCAFSSCNWVGADEAAFGAHFRSLSEEDREGHACVPVEKGYYETKTIGQKCSCGALRLMAS